MSEAISPAIDRATIESGLITILDKMSSKWGRSFQAGIGPQTQLGADLGFDSMQLVKLVGRIQKHFKVKKLPFHLLLLDEEKLSDDLMVRDIVDFLDRVLNEQ